MDQSFAKVYQIAETSFIGCVKKGEGSIETVNTGEALISLNTKDVYKEHERVSTFDLPYLSKVELINKRPLKSFFFKDYEGHDFEIQELIKKEDIDLF